jgi:anti-anti-sigma factor
VSTTLARMTQEWHDDMPVVRVEGEVDASNAHEVGDRLRSLLTNRSMALIVDLSATTYLDSAGLNLLFALGEELRGRQQRLGLVVPHGSPIERMVMLVGLDKAVSVDATLAEAIRRGGEVPE